MLIERDCFVILRVDQHRACSRLRLATEDPAPPELVEALMDFKRRHLEEWLDTPIPALSGMTPREAATKPRKRKELVMLLKEIEHHESRAPREQQVDYLSCGANWGSRTRDRTTGVDEEPLRTPKTLNRDAPGRYTAWTTAFTVPIEMR